MKKVISFVICIALIMISCSSISILATAADYVAMIVETGKRYDKIATAFNVCETGQTIRVLKDCTAEYLGGNTSHKMGRTIDLDGHTLTCNGDRFISPGSGTGNWSVVVKNGTLTNAGDDNFQSFAMVRANSFVTFENMTIYECATARPNGYGFIGTLTSTSGVLNFKDCKIYECSANTTQGYNVKGSTVNMYNTTVESYTPIFYTNSTYNVYSGTFTTLGDKVLATPTIAPTSTITVNEPNKLVVECNHNYVDGVCEYCFDLAITMEKGASMRIDNATDGIRFSATVDKTVLDAYTQSGAIVSEIGMLIAKSDIADSDMVLDNAKESLVANAHVDADVVVAKYGDVTMKTNEAANAYEIIGSIVEIKAGNAEQKYVAKAYIKFTVGSETKVVYSAKSDARSIKDVATSVKTDTEYYSSLCAEHKEAVDKWLSSKSDVTE